MEEPEGSCSWISTGQFLRALRGSIKGNTSELDAEGIQSWAIGYNHSWAAEEPKSYWT